MAETYGSYTKVTTFDKWTNCILVAMNIFPTLIKQYAWFINLLLISSLFLSSWNTKKWIKVKWLKWNRIKLTSTPPVFILSTRSAEHSYYTVGLLKQSKSKTWFYYEISHVKTFGGKVFKSGPSKRLSSTNLTWSTLEHFVLFITWIEEYPIYTLRGKTLAGRMFRDLREFWTNSRKFAKAYPMRNELRRPIWWKLKQICLNMSKNYQTLLLKVIIRES